MIPTTSNTPVHHQPPKSSPEELYQHAIKRLQEFNQNQSSSIALNEGEHSFLQAVKEGLSDSGKLGHGYYKLAIGYWMIDAEKKGDEYENKAAENNHPQALLSLAKKHVKNKENEKAIKRLETLDSLELSEYFDLGTQRDGRRTLSELYLKSKKTENIQRAVKLLEAIGDSEALFQLGIIYHRGLHDIPSNPQKAEEFLAKGIPYSSIEDSRPRKKQAMEILSKIYSSRKEWEQYVKLLDHVVATPKDFPKALFERCVFQTLTSKKGQKRINFDKFHKEASAVLNGKLRVPKEPKSRIFYHLGRAELRKEKGWSRYQTRYKKAVEQWKQGAFLGHSGCHYLLGLAYAGGNGVKKDLKKAEKHLKKAADLQNPSADKLLKHLKDRNVNVVVEHTNDTIKPELMESLSNLKLRDQELQDFLVTKGSKKERFSHMMKRNKPLLKKIRNVALAVLAIAGVVAGIVALCLAFPKVMAIIGAVLLVIGIVAFAIGAAMLGAVNKYGH